MDENALLEQVKIRLMHYKVKTVQGEDGENDVVVYDHKMENPLLKQLIKQCITKVKAARRYPSSYTEEMIERDLEQFEDVIIDTVVYYRSQAGESFMKSYSENGVSRTWVDSVTLYNTVLPISHID